jgi:hypothetical protein
MSQELTDAELREIASEMRSWANAGHKMLDEWAGRIERAIAARLERPAVEDDKFSLLRTWWTMTEVGRELDGDHPLSDDTVILYYSGCGAGVFVTAGDFRKMFANPAGPGGRE